MSATYQQVVNAISNEVKDQKLSVAHVAREAEIHQNTLRRKLAGQGELTLVEVIKLARVLEVEPSKFLPESGDHS